MFMGLLVSRKHKSFAFKFTCTVIHAGSGRYIVGSQNIVTAFRLRRSLRSSVTLQVLNHKNQDHASPRVAYLRNYSLAGKDRSGVDVKRRRYMSSQMT